jgi:hypothetical protein
MAKQIINDFLRKHQEACIKEVEAMMQHPLSLEEMKEQVKRIHSQSEKGMRETKENNLSRSK